MMEEVSKAVWGRGKAIFEREGRKDVVWGQATYDGKQAFHFEEREGRNSPTVAALTEDMRKIYFDRAREELKAENNL